MLVPWIGGGEALVSLRVLTEVTLPAISYLRPAFCVPYAAWVIPNKKGKAP